MRRPLRASDVVIGLVTENAPRMLTQSVRLLRSIRWLGGEAAQARVIVCGVGPLDAAAHRALEELGAEIRIVARFHPASPTGNRHPLIAELLDAPQEVMLLLDCDTIVVQDPLPYLNATSFQAKIAPGATVSDDVFERLFAHFHLSKPPRRHTARLTGELTIPYFNGGVIAMPKPVARTLAPAWRRYNQILADNPELVAPCQRHLHQASLTLALAETGVPIIELPEAMNYQINAPELPRDPELAAVDPVIIHYHHLATDDGYLLPCPYPGAHARIETFHEQLRAHGVAQARIAATAEESRPILILGMHRSGTSVVTELVHALGSYAGSPDELAPPDIFNPNGYWEHLEALNLDREIMQALSANWRSDVTAADVTRLPDEQRAAFVARARAVAQSMRGRGSFVLKDPRMSLLFPLWREALGEPVSIIVWRDPLAVARSLLTRNQQPLIAGLASWEHHNRTALRHTTGLPRILLSYDELIADPLRVVRDLYAALTRFGISGLSLPPDERIRQIVNPDFNRSRRTTGEDDALLDDDQRALLESLRSGAALETEVPPTSPRTAALLQVVGVCEELRDDVAELDALLAAVFASRSWRIGHALTSLLRAGRRGSAVSALERWQESRRRRIARPA